MELACLISMHPFWRGPSYHALHQGLWKEHWKEDPQSLDSAVRATCCGLALLVEGSATEMGSLIS